MLYVVKRDGRRAEFNHIKITNALKKAAGEINSNLKESDFLGLTQKIIKKVEENYNEEVTVEEIQNIVVDVLFDEGYEDIGTLYSNYRNERTKIREIKSDLMNIIDKIGVETDRDNANIGNNFSAKLLRIASESNKWHNLAMMPKHLSKAHENGDIYYHDLDSYNLTINCLHIPTKEVLTNGFNTGYGYIRPPKRLESAAELSCILLQSSQNDMFGGQSHPDFDNDLGIFVDSTRQEIRKELIDVGAYNDRVNEITERKLRRAISQPMQAIIYNLNTMHVRHVA